MGLIFCTPIGLILIFHLRSLVMGTVSSGPIGKFAQWGVFFFVWKKDPCQPWGREIVRYMRVSGRPEIFPIKSAYTLDEVHFLFSFFKFNFSY